MRVSCCSIFSEDMRWYFCQSQLEQRYPTRLKCASQQADRSLKLMWLSSFRCANSLLFQPRLGAGEATGCWRPAGKQAGTQQHAAEAHLQTESSASWLCQYLTYGRRWWQNGVWLGCHYQHRMFFVFSTANFWRSWQNLFIFSHF